MRTPNAGFDHATMREAFGGAGIDPRQWVSFGLVDAGTPGEDAPPVAFDDELGPLVNVTLQPSAIPVVCRVAGSFAGNGEASYRPFVQGDEVLVVLPEGDERAGATIIGRLNNGIDLWPTMVGGLDATANNFAFDRARTPYVFETSASWMVRSAGTGAFISLSQDGKIVMSNADKAFLAFNPDFIGMQDASGSLLLQLDLHDHQIVLQAGKARLAVGVASTSLLNTGTVSVSGYGAQPYDHATSAEAVVNLIANTLALEWAPILTTLAAISAPLTGSSLATALTPLVNPAGLKAILLGAIAASGSASTATFSAAISAALLLKPGLPNFPSVGCAGFMVG